MKKISKVFSLLFICSVAAAQNFYVLSQGANQPNNTTYILNLSNCTSVNLNGCPPANDKYYDIATFNQYLYYVSDNGNLYRKIITDSNSCEFLGSFNYPVNSLVADAAGIIYSSGELNGVTKLFKYQVNTFSNLGSFPANFHPEGDLFFYENRLFMTCEDNDGSSFLAEVNMATPSQSCFYMNLQNLKAWAAFSTQTGNLSRSFVVASNTVISASTSSLIEISIPNQTISSAQCTYPFPINGAASYYTHTSGVTLCSNTSISQENLTELFFKANNPVADMIRLNTNIPYPQISSIQVYDASGNKIISLDHTNQTNEIEFSFAAPGLYMILLKTTQGKEYRQKLIKVTH